MIQAGVYAATLHYLKAVEALRSDADGPVVEDMKEMPTDDPLAVGSNPRRRPQAPRHVPVRSEEARGSKYAWDYYKVRATIPAAEAFRPMEKAAARSSTAEPSDRPHLPGRPAPARRPIEIPSHVEPEDPMQGLMQDWPFSSTASSITRPRSTPGVPSCRDRSKVRFTGPIMPRSARAPCASPSAWRWTASASATASRRWPGTPGGISRPGTASPASAPSTTRSIRGSSRTRSSTS